MAHSSKLIVLANKIYIVEQRKGEVIFTNTQGKVVLRLPYQPTETKSK